MGKSKNGMKIHWNGQVGNVVGYSVRGNDYWRSLANHHSDARSDAQFLQRAKIAVTSSFVRNVGEVYKIGYAHYNTSKSPRTNFFRQVYRNALSGSTIDNLLIDPSKILVSRGSLPPAFIISASVAPASQTVTVTWTDNSDAATASASDKLMLTIFNSTKMLSVYNSSIAVRSTETASLVYPDDWAGDTIYVYATFLSPSSASDSAYLGFYTA